MYSINYRIYNLSGITTFIPLKPEDSLVFHSKVQTLDRDDLVSKTSNFGYNLLSTILYQVSRRRWIESKKTQIRLHLYTSD